jgi:cell division protein FtsL
MKKPVLLLSFFFAVIVVLSIVRITVLNDISTTGVELVQIENNIDIYKKQNAVLEEQYLQLSSLTNLEAKAKQLGFVPENQNIYLAPPPLALKQ